MGVCDRLNSVAAKLRGPHGIACMYGHCLGIGVHGRQCLPADSPLHAPVDTALQAREAGLWKRIEEEEEEKKRLKHSQVCVAHALRVSGQYHRPAMQNEPNLCTQATKRNVLSIFAHSEALAHGPECDARSAAASKIQVRY